MNPENKHNNLYTVYIQPLEVYLVNKKCIYKIYLEGYEH